MRKRKYLLTIMLISLMMLAAASPSFSQGKNKGDGGNGNGGNGNGNSQSQGNGNNDNGNGNNGNGNNQSQSNNNGNNGNGNGNNGNGNNQSQEPEPEQPQAEPVQEQVVPMSIVEPSNTLLGCQKNNPDRLDCSSLEVSGYCEGTTAVFTIRNTGERGNGDMLASTSYRVVVNGSVVESGSVQISGGATMQVRYSGGGSVTLEADQQVGHPGSSRPRVTLDCGASVPTQEVTPEPTQEITPEPTIEVTPTEEVTPEPTVEVTEEPTEEVTPEPTVEVTEEPTQEVTPEPTEEVLPFDLSGDVYCDSNGYVTFIVTNNGGAMTESLPYSVFNNDGVILDSGSFSLSAGESTWIYSDSSATMLNVGNGVLILTIECYVATPEPTEEPQPFDLTGDVYCDEYGGYVVFTVSNQGASMTDSLPYTVTDANGNVLDYAWLILEAGETTWIYADSSAVTLNVGEGLLILNAQCQPTSTEEPQPFDLTGDAYCDEYAGYVVFTVTNQGASMTESLSYTITDANGNVLDYAWLVLEAGETTWIYTDVNAVKLDIDGGLLVLNVQCQPVPTEEVTPEPTVEITPEPTIEVTPTEEVTPEPTVEITPEPTIVFTPTPLAPLACQKNNPDRKDCSSLEVTVTCEGNVAVFTIRNTGEAGDGDMREATAYRLMVGGSIIEMGSVDLDGAQTMQVRYSGGGTVTLQANQQVGHPGKSQPRATINCGS